MSSLKEIQTDTFEQEVLKSDKPVLLEFGAVWCQPCRILEPLLEQLAGEWGDSVKVVKLDVDQAPQITIDYQVLSVPTMMLFKDGKMLERLVGYQPKEKINSRVQPHLQPA